MIAIIFDIVYIDDVNNIVLFGHDFYSGAMQWLQQAQVRGYPCTDYDPHSLKRERDSFIMALWCLGV